MFPAVLCEEETGEEEFEKVEAEITVEEFDKIVQEINISYEKALQSLLRLTAMAAGSSVATFSLMNEHNAGNDINNDNDGLNLLSEVVVEQMKNGEIE